MNHEAGNTKQYSRSVTSYQQLLENDENVRELEACMREMNYEEILEVIKELKKLMKNKQDQE